MSEVLAREAVGRSFVHPAQSWALSKGDRLALAVVAGGKARFGTQWLTYSTEPGAVDLSLLHTGRMPLLAEHYRTLESLLGVVVRVEPKEGALHCLARFGPGRLADQLWDMLQAGFPLSLSIGGSVQHAMPDGEDARGGQHYRATRWRLEEISVCVYGKDESGRLRAVEPIEDPDELVRITNPEGEDPARVAVRKALRLPDWHLWAALDAGPALAERFGLKTTEFCAALESAVADHADKLERGLVP